MTAIATPVVAAWLAGVLNGDTALMALATGGVWRNKAPEGTVMPYVVFNVQTANPKILAGGSIMWEELLAEVKGFDRDINYAGLKPIADRILTLLHRFPTQTIPGGTLEACLYNSGVSRDDPPVSGIVFTQLGSQFRLWVQAN
jgi:hypothetical protein